MFGLKIKRNTTKYFFLTVLVIFLLVSVFTPFTFANTQEVFGASDMILVNPFQDSVNSTFNGSTGSAKFSTFAEFLWIFTNIFNLLIQVLIVLAFVAFLWGIVKTIFLANDTNQRAQGRKALLFSTFALFALVSIWGIIYVVQRTFFF